METLLGQALLHLHEVLHVGLSPAGGVPVPHVEILLHLLHGEGGGYSQQQQEAQAGHVLSVTGDRTMTRISKVKSF